MRFLFKGNSNINLEIIKENKQLDIIKNKLTAVELAILKNSIKNELINQNKIKK